MGRVAEAFGWIQMQPDPIVTRSQPGGFFPRSVISPIVASTKTCTLSSRSVAVSVSNSASASHEDLLPRGFDPDADVESSNAGRNPQDASDMEVDARENGQEKATVMDILTSAQGRLDALAERGEATGDGKMRRMIQRLIVIRSRTDDRISLAPFRSPLPSRVRRVLQQPGALLRQDPSAESSSGDDSPTSMFELLDGE